jgi:hypothetical protein
MGRSAQSTDRGMKRSAVDHQSNKAADRGAAPGNPAVQGEPRPLAEWHEDLGPMLWWFFPIEEPPYVGGPLDTDWPGYHTHWTPIPVPGPRLS